MFRSPRTGSRKAHRPLVQPLESRLLFYALSGSAWPSTNVSVSYIPDGTTLNAGRISGLFAHLDAQHPTAVWQQEFARALQTWAQYSPLNFYFVNDDGSPQGTSGLGQGDPRFGDIRLGASSIGSTGTGFFPSTIITTGGDVTLSTNYPYNIGSVYDLYSILLHESGHALGLEHSLDATAVMSGSIAGRVANDLSPDDIAGIQAIYGVRQHDAYDAAASNNSLGSATALSLDSSGAINFRADLTSMGDVDYYSIVAPANANGQLTISVDARGLSLLAPKLLVYDASGRLVGSSSGQYGTVATLSLSGLVAGQRYVIVADGATSDVFGMGAYKVAAQFGTGPTSPPPPPPAPTYPVLEAPSQLSGTVEESTLRLIWADNSIYELGFRVQRSVDGGANWSDRATLLLDSTEFFDSVEPGKSYQYRVLAFNDWTAPAVSSSTTIVVPPAQAPAPAVPDAPSNLTFTRPAKNKVKLSWTDNATSEVGYIIERSLDGVSWGQVALAGSNATSYVLTTSQRDPAYSYRVVAYNDAGRATPSNVVTV